MVVLIGKPLAPNMHRTCIGHIGQLCKKPFHKYVLSLDVFLGFYAVVSGFADMWPTKGLNQSKTHPNKTVKICNTIVYN